MPGKVKSQMDSMIDEFQTATVLNDKFSHQNFYMTNNLIFLIRWTYVSIHILSHDYPVHKVNHLAYFSLRISGWQTPTSQSC